MIGRMAGWTDAQTSPCFPSTHSFRIYLVLTKVSQCKTGEGTFFSILIFLWSTRVMAAAYIIIISRILDFRS